MKVELGDLEYIQDSNIFSYEVDKIEEKFILKVIDTNINVDIDYGKEPDVTIRVTPVFYEGENAAFYLPIGEISPESDLKNTLVQLLLKTIENFGKNLINTPIEKPGVQHYNMLKLAFLMDMPGICCEFLKGKIRLIDDEKNNVNLVDIFCHNVGKFLRDERVKKLYEDLGKEDELESAYNNIALKKLKFLKRWEKFLDKKKVKNDRNLLKKWFAQRYDVCNYWTAIQISCFIPVGFAFAFLGVILKWSVIGQVIPIYYLLPLSFLIIGGFSFIIGLFRSNIEKDFILKFFEMLHIRLFLGILIGGVLLLGLQEALWRAVLENRIKLIPIVICVFILLLLYFFQLFKNEKIERKFWRQVLAITKIYLWIIFLSVLSVSSILILVGKGVLEKLGNNYTYYICQQLVIFWVAFSCFAGIFIQLFWQEKKITEPI